VECIPTEPGFNPWLKLNHSLSPAQRSHWCLRSQAARAATLPGRAVAVISGNQRRWAAAVQSRWQVAARWRLHTGI